MLLIILLHFCAEFCFACVVFLVSLSFKKRLFNNEAAGLQRKNSRWARSRILNPCIIMRFIYLHCPLFLNKLNTFIFRLYVFLFEENVSAACSKYCWTFVLFCVFVCVSSCSCWAPWTPAPVTWWVCTTSWTGRKRSEKLFKQGTTQSRSCANDASPHSVSFRSTEEITSLCHKAENCFLSSLKV